MHGGVALFVKSDYSFRIGYDIENIWIETLEMILGVIYKTSHFSNLDFLDALEVTEHSIYCVFPKKLFNNGSY